MTKEETLDLIDGILALANSIVRAKKVEKELLSEYLQEIEYLTKVKSQVILDENFTLTPAQVKGLEMVRSQLNTYIEKEE